MADEHARAGSKQLAGVPPAILILGRDRTSLGATVVSGKDVGRGRKTGNHEWNGKEGVIPHAPQMKGHTQEQCARRS